MTSKVEVQMRLCVHRTVIEATDRGDGTVDLRIESECKDVQNFARLLPSVGQEDYTRTLGSRVYEAAERAHLTPTCLIPVAVFNVVWMETGMISKRLALKEGSVCIRFLE